jgi:uncharacterized protein with PQ loop repeat
VSTAIGVPQLFRLLSRRDTAGVSVATWWLTAVAGLTWVGHNVRHDEVVAAVTNGVSAAVAVAILYRCYHDSAAQPRSALVIPLMTAGVDVVVFLLAPDHLGWVAAGIGIVQFLPQARAVLTTEQLSGVSLPTWCLAVIASALWITYGVLHSDAAIIASPLVTGSLSLLIVARLLGRRAVRREPA